MLWWMQAAVYSLDFPCSYTKVRTLQLCALGSAVLQWREEEGKHSVRTKTYQINIRSAALLTVSTLQIAHQNSIFPNGSDGKRMTVAV